MVADSPTSGSNPQEKRVQETLLAFCQSLRNYYGHIKQLTGLERANVDKTLAKASRYELMVNCDPASVPYSADQVEHVQIECLQEINTRLISTGDLVSQMVECNSKVLRTYQDLEKASHDLDWSQSCTVISGSEKQRPLEYYLNDGNRIVYQLNALVTGYKLTFNALDIRQVASIQRFRDCLKLSEELDLYLQEFLAYTVFITK